MISQQTHGFAERRILSARFLVIAVVLLLVHWSERTEAQSANYPARVIRIVMPFPPGTAPDLALRMLAEKLSERWQQSVIVENKPGASSIIGTDAVAKAPADGYTLLATVTLLAQNHSLRKDLPYDTFRDLVPVTQLQREQLVLYVRGDSSISSIADLTARAKDRPHELNFATWGVGSTAHLMIEQFRQDKQALMTHVPYKGAAEIASAVVAGVVDVRVGDLLSSTPFFQSRQLRAIAVTGPVRAPALPAVETFTEAGIGGFGEYNWVGLFAAAGTPPQIIWKISDAVNEIVSDPTYSKQLKEKFFVLPSLTTPDQFAAIFEQEVARWGAIVRSAGIQIP